jgi:hypothetical protein
MFYFDLYLMKRQKIHKKLLLLFSLLMLVITSCDLNDLTYSGPALVEFSNISSEPPASWVSIGSIWATTLTGNFERAPLQVALITPQQNHAVEIGYYVADHVYHDLDANKITTILPEHENWTFLETTGVAGEDYQIRDGGIITIPVGSSFGQISIELFPTTDRTLYLVLEERDVKPSENYKIFRLRIRP